MSKDIAKGKQTKQTSMSWQKKDMPLSHGSKCEWEVLLKKVVLYIVCTHPPSISSHGKESVENDIKKANYWPLLKAMGWWLIEYIHETPSHT